MKGAMLVLISVVLLGAGSGSTLGFAAEETSKEAASAEPRVNLNTATSEELVELPGIGEKVAARIVAYRESNGSFQKIEELMNVKGIGEKTFLKLRSRLFVEPKKAKSRR